MNRKIVLLNLALLAAIAGLGLDAAQALAGGRGREARRDEPQGAAAGGDASPTPAPVAAVSPSDYLEVATKTLYSSDRNPNVIVDAPKPPPPPPPMPALPVYYGQMTFGDPVVILTVAGAPAAEELFGGPAGGRFQAGRVHSRDHQVRLERQGSRAQAGRAGAQGGAANNGGGRLPRGGFPAYTPRRRRRWLPPKPLPREAAR